MSQVNSLVKQVKAFPKMPGVYLMKDERGAVIYIGKAKSLRARVRSYFGKGDGRVQIEFLRKRVQSIDTIVTQTEDQAFILERDLIDKHKPRYNIRLKDDKAYLSVRIDQNREWPRIELVRRTEEDGATYFGPYTFSYELRTVLDVIKRVVPLRTCTDTVFFNRQRPCLEYQIKRCAGPCCLAVDKNQYQGWVDQAVSILQGNTKPLQDELERLMNEASENLRFEDAADYRDRLTILDNFSHGHQIVTHQGENRDVFGLYREEQLASLSVLEVRGGRITESVNFSFTDVQVPDEEILESALSQFYEGRPIPEEVVLPHGLPNQSLVLTSLETRRGSNIEMSIPKKGIRKRLLGLAALNARQHFLAKFNAEERYLDQAKTLARMLGLRQIPRRIECVDISNFQGSDIVGAVVAFFDGSPHKEGYRKYKISQQGKPDDFAAVREVVHRRLTRGMAENDLPDLLVIDGGPGQLSAALGARDELQVTLDIVAIAKLKSIPTPLGDSKREKKPERVYREGEGTPIVLDEKAESTHLMARMRDEVHRFVIGYHRASRQKRTFMSMLDHISGIGPERKRRLLKKYGTVQKMKSVPAEELAKEGRMSKKLAEKILKAIG